MPDEPMMQGFPPIPAHRVTQGNWRTAPYSRWGFQHVREFIPTASIPNDPSNVRSLARRFVDLANIGYTSADRKSTVQQMLDGSANDAFLVLHNGDIVCEEYGNGMGPTTAHILFSVSKSVTAMVAGIIVERGQLEPESQITDYIPEMAGSAYAGATVRHLLDMTAGIAFDEDYSATDGAIIRYREAAGWNVRSVTDDNLHLRAFLTEMGDLEKQHGGQFRYISPNSDLLGWVLERATDTRFVDLMSKFLWQPMGASQEACITIDSVGAPRTAGGICATIHDLAIFGQLIAENGVRDGVQIIPGEWIADTRKNGSTEEWNTGDYADDYPDWEMRYRNKWYVTGGPDAPLFAAGIHGQFLFIDPVRKLVVAKFSSQATAVDSAEEMSFLRACVAIGDTLGSTEFD